MTVSRVTPAAFLFPLLFLPRESIAAQVVDSGKVQTLERISVSVTRAGPRTPLELPFAVSRMTPDSSRPGLRRTSVGDLLLGVPGVQVQERANPAQDPRLSIRGFGSRSAFGVRGVRVLRDGVPLSLPDGQTPLDFLDLETVGDVEVIRGTAAALFGNAAGGVVSFRSREPEPSPFSARARAWNGAGLLRWNATVGSRIDQAAGFTDPSVLASFTRTSGDGAREWSQQQTSSAFVRAHGLLRGTRVEVHGTWYDNALAQNTGALTAEELARDPALPDPLNVTKQSRKEVTHTQFALSVGREWRAHDVDVTVFTGGRSLANPLPFSIIGVERRASGASWRAGTRIADFAGTEALRLTVGMDAQWQRDDRANWENCAGLAEPTDVCPNLAIERGATRLDQREDVDGIGSYVRAELELPAQVFVSGALRHDRVGFTVTDRFVTADDSDDSGDRTMTAISPLAGIVWRVKPLVSVYANWSTAFETPTITELTNQPDGSAGLNAVIAPQRTRTVEAGLQGWIGTRVQGELAAFSASVDDELVSFDVPNAPGRRAFRNAGRTARRGVEASMRTTWSWLEVGSAYTWSRFRFVDYVVGDNDFGGNRIPGIPEHQVQAYGTVHWGEAFGTLETRMNSNVSANDAGTVTSAGYAVWSLRGGYTLRAASHSAVDAVVGIENMFDRRYASSVVTNASRGRFYEPGLARRVYVGLTVRAAR